MAKKASWYETGYEGAEEEAEKRSMGYPPDRFWLPAGAAKEMAFVGDDPFCVREHQWRDSNGRWHNATCLVKIDDKGCPGCGTNGVSRSDYIGHYTIVDITGYTTKNGQENKHRLVLLPAKTKVLNKLRMKKEAKGSLLGQMWNLSRADGNAPNTGDDFEHIREIKMDGLYTVVSYKGKSLKDMVDKANGSGSEAEKTRKYLAHHFQVPDEGPIPESIPQFNYPVHFEPLEYDVFQSRLSDVKPFETKGGNSSSSSSSSSSDEVPF